MAHEAKTVFVRVPQFAYPATGTGAVPDGVVTYDAEILIDFEALALSQGRRAVKSKSRRTVLANGAVIVKVKNFRRRPEPGEQNGDR